MLPDIRKTLQHLSPHLSPHLGHKVIDRNDFGIFIAFLLILSAFIIIIRIIVTDNDHLLVGIFPKD